MDKAVKRQLRQIIDLANRQREALHHIRELAQNCLLIEDGVRHYHAAGTLVSCGRCGQDIRSEIHIKEGETP